MQTGTGQRVRERRRNAVCPGDIETPMLLEGIEAGGEEIAAGLARKGAAFPFGRVARREITKPILGRYPRALYHLRTGVDSAGFFLTGRPLE